MVIIYYAISAGLLAVIIFSLVVSGREKKKDPCEGCHGEKWGYCWDGYYGECKFLKGKKEKITKS